MAAARRAPRRPPRKDRLVQTRVPRDLEETLKREARRRRVTVSHLIRGLIEDTFQLVDGVVADVDQIVSDSVSLVRTVGESARRLAEGRRRGRRRPAAPGDPVSDVYAWNEVVLQRAVHCSQCGAAIARGRRAFVGLSDDPDSRRAWLCAACIAALGARERS
jgi:hypothetical protein